MLNRSIQPAVLLLALVPGTVPSAAAQDVTTFARDIAPILARHCIACHRPGQVAPFSLLTYEDARPRATRLAEVTRSRQMPPWKPEPGHGDFLGERRMSDAEIAAIQDWVNGGMQRGSGASLTPPARLDAARPSETPDLVVSMPEPYLMPAAGRDVFRTFVIPIATDSMRYVTSVEFLPGNAKVVHHANIKVDRTRLSRRWDENEPGLGYEGGGSREARFPDGMFLGWTPGQSPRVSPDGMSWHLEPGSDLVIELHLMPGSQPEPVQVGVAFRFGDHPPSRTAYMLRLGRQDLDIPPGERNYVTTDAYTLPVDVEALAVQPHAHFLAREVRAWATLPGGTIRPLVLIRDWDFHWQDVYTYAQPLSLPKGTTIEMRYTYDNSATSPRNRNTIPRRVTFGQTSASEMGSLWLQVVPQTSAELATLDRDFSPKLLRDDIAGNEKWLEVEPKNAQLRAELAACYLEAERFEEGITQLREAVRLEPSAGRHYDLGRVLLYRQNYEPARAAFLAAFQRNPSFGEARYGLAVAEHGLGNLDAAIELYQRTIDTDAANVAAHYNLGRALATKGLHERAVMSYRRAIALAPEDADAHHALAQALAVQGLAAEAVYHYRRALEIEPDRQGALLDLAWILATTANPDIRVPVESVRLAERAAALGDGKNATVFDTLAAAYAAAGQTERAISNAERAVALATESGDPNLAAEIRVRLERYRLRR